MILWHKGLQRKINFHELNISRQTVNLMRLIGTITGIDGPLAKRFSEKNQFPWISLRNLYSPNLPYARNKKFKPPPNLIPKIARQWRP